MEAYVYCPRCGCHLSSNPEQIRVCPNCGFKHYDNPIPAVACLIPYLDGIVLVRRNVSPFKGEWCLPCGFVERNEDPEVAVMREVEEETGLIIRPTKLLLACRPGTTEKPVNELVLHYLGEYVGGTLHFGDDAKEVGCFRAEDMPTLCFMTHRKVVAGWFGGRWASVPVLALGT